MHGRPLPLLFPPFRRTHARTLLSLSLLGRCLCLRHGGPRRVRKLLHLILVLRQHAGEHNEIEAVRRRLNRVAAGNHPYDLQNARSPHDHTVTALRLQPIMLHDHKPIPVDRARKTEKGLHHHAARRTLATVAAQAQALPANAGAAPVAAPVIHHQLLTLHECAAARAAKGGDTEARVLARSTTQSSGPLPLTVELAHLSEGLRNGVVIISRSGSGSIRWVVRGLVDGVILAGVASLFVLRVCVPLRLLWCAFLRVLTVVLGVVLLAGVVVRGKGFWVLLGLVGRRVGGPVVTVVLGLGC